MEFILGVAGKERTARYAAGRQPGNGNRSTFAAHTSPIDRLADNGCFAIRVISRARVADDRCHVIGETCNVRPFRRKSVRRDSVNRRIFFD